MVALPPLSVAAVAAREEEGVLPPAAVEAAPFWPFVDLPGLREEDWGGVF